MWPEIKKNVAILQNGGIILYPTDTIWGLGCDALNEEAIARIYSLKQREDAKSMIILLAEAKDIFKYVGNPPPDIIAILQQFKQPTTVIYEQGVNLPSILLNQNGSVGIRVTNDPFCKALIKRMNRPLVSTSANISGRPSPVNFWDIDEQIKNGVDSIVQHRQNENTESKPSTILVMKDGRFEIIRK